MKKIFVYSPEKFNSFSEQKKLRVIISFIETIADRWTNEVERLRLLNNLRICLEYMPGDAVNIGSNIKRIADYLSPDINLDDFLYLTKNIWHNYGILSNKEPTPFISDTKNRNKDKYPHPIPLNIVLDNLRSAFNVGSIIRTSECFGVNKIYFCGYTPTPDNMKVRKTTMATENKIDWVYYQKTLTAINDLKEETTIIALETGDEAQFIHQSIIPKPATLILGNEALGINKKILGHCDLIVKIPVLGWKTSFNVATAYGIGCYEIYKQWSSSANE